MNTNDLSKRLKWIVGLFTLSGIVLTIGISIFVNDRPFWWRKCELVYITVDDATGLKVKSSVRSLGIQIGYLKSVDLAETSVRLGICITAPVEVLPVTRAFIRAEGFLGDKFVELKPVKYVGGAIPITWIFRVLDFWMNSAHAQVTIDARSESNKRDIPIGKSSQDVSQLVEQVNGLVDELRQFTGNVKSAFQPEEMKKTVQQLNAALENAAKTLSPQGGITTTAQRSLAKLEEAIEQLRDTLTRVNQGKGSVGMLIHDPVYAEEIKTALRKLNSLLGRVDQMILMVEIGGDLIPSLDGGRAWANIELWPKADRYYILGVSSNPWGKTTTRVVSTYNEAGQKLSSEKKIETEYGGYALSVQFGKVFSDRFESSIGLIYGDGGVSLMAHLGPESNPRMISLQNQLVIRLPGEGRSQLDDRITAIYRPFEGVFLRAGMEGVRRINGKFGWSVGAGIKFTDDDVRVLFAFL